MAGAVSIVPFEERHHAACTAILGALPDWFGIPESNTAYLQGLRELPAFVALRDGDVVGFASLRPHFERSAELEVMAVRPDQHRSGVGRALVRHCEAWLRARGFAVLHVKTLAPSHPDPFYARTRAFYLALGFEPVFETPALWGPENPALVSVKLLSRS
ncbi:MAG TPA: GNAT family N-acetyltransferase [Candidatus Eisenbacteria bacterium]|nr:GNAT family N-acetyltransferase [Candidatus Eisenbacteria bacterium]